MPKLKNSNSIFWVIFKHYDCVEMIKDKSKKKEFCMRYIVILYFELFFVKYKKKQENAYKKLIEQTDFGEESIAISSHRWWMCHCLG